MYYEKYKILKEGGVFLVRKQEGEDMKEFEDFLHSKGYAGINGSYGCPWWFVGIDVKYFLFGKPGIELIKPKNKKIVSCKDFIELYSIINGEE